MIMRLKDTPLAIALVVLAASVAYPQPPQPNRGRDIPDFSVQVWSDVVTDFSTRVLSYVALRTELERGLPALTVTGDPAETRRTKQLLAKRIREAPELRVLLAIPRRTAGDRVEGGLGSGQGIAQSAQPDRGQRVGYERAPERRVQAVERRGRWARGTGALLQRLQHAVAIVRQRHEPDAGDRRFDRVRTGNGDAHGQWARLLAGA